PAGRAEPVGRDRPGVAHLVAAAGGQLLRDARGDDSALRLHAEGGRSCRLVRPPWPTSSTACGNSTRPPPWGCGCFWRPKSSSLAAFLSPTPFTVMPSAPPSPRPARSC